MSKMASFATLPQAIWFFQGKSCVCYSLARFWGHFPHMISCVLNDLAIQTIVSRRYASISVRRERFVSDERQARNERQQDDGRDVEKFHAPEFHQRRDCRRRSRLVGELSIPHQRAGPGPGAWRARQRRTSGHAHGEWPGAPRRRDEAGDAGADAPLQTGTDRHQDRLRPRGMRRVHGAGGRCAAVFVLGAHPHRARTGDHDDRRAGERRRHAVAGAAGRGRRARLPVRVLHAGVRDGGHRLPEDESQSLAAGTRARRIRQSVPLPGLRQDSHRADAWRRAHAGSLTMADTTAKTNKLIGQNYTTPDLVAKVTGKARYAEDWKADGMLFTKLLLSPMPHARVTR